MLSCLVCRATLPAIQHRQAGNPGTTQRVQETMSDTPKKTLTLTRQPASGEAPAPGQVKRSGKRIIRREDLPTTRQTGRGREGQAHREETHPQTRTQSTRYPTQRPESPRTERPPERLHRLARLPALGYRHRQGCVPPGE
ncbi:hypothetical protein [Thiothrix nivea]|uniref:hypothetical protein n=1 Tax=Thiothrix nivea TaxID=1031 RepID=UPI0012B6849A|nr:hypothetical protein [Thiothrix nivea]